MIRLPPRSTRTDTLFPYTTLFRSPALRRLSVVFLPSAASLGCDRHLPRRCASPHCAVHWPPFLRGAVELQVCRLHKTGPMHLSAPSTCADRWALSEARL